MKFLNAGELDDALDACAREPVHIPGAIQPHGALVAMDADLRQVSQVSANIEAILGVSVADVLAASPGAWDGGRFLEQIQAQLEAPGRSGASIVSLKLRGAVRRFRLLAYRSGSRVVLEFEPLSGHPERLLFGALADWQGDLSGHAGRDQLLQALVALVRELAGYDRVMIYRFDDEWNGSVIAESRVEGADSYLNHHFPASDIPVQVRQLYGVTRVRDIPDATAEAVPLVPAVDPVDPTPLDLSPGILRAVAPIHVRYLANMGVVASMSIALHLDGRLWGLLACHKATPNILSPALRAALLALVQTACLQLELIQARDDAALVHRANDTREMLANQGGEFSDPDDIVARHGPAWLQLFQAGGAVLVAGDRMATVGTVPDAASIHAMVGWLSGQHPGETAWSSRELGRTGLAAFCEPAQAAGLLAMPLPIRSPRNTWLLFFRAEKTEVRTWAGNPDKVARQTGGRLSPRQSFASWNETVSGKSAAWKPVELRSAADLASDLAALIVAAEIGRLNQRLEHLASSDHLTGLWNRYRMEEAIGHEVSLAERYGAPCALVMFDIDHFKRLNDTFGHDAGDEVLRQVAQAVAGQLRDTDFVSRWGGEEFIVLAANTGLAGASKLAERLRSAVAGLAIRHYGIVTASFGVATHRKGEASRDLVKRADMAMYAAKQGGRNRVELSAG
jgi:diguanylate cyclase (GGDEF)-like protein